jgi:hypothetical protein
MCNDLNTIISAAKNAQDYIKKLERKIISYENRDERRCNFHGYKIVRDIMKNICAGIDEESALLCVHSDYSKVLKVEHIKSIWNASRRQKNALNLYAKTYMAQKMKQSGFKVSEIADTMGISITSVANLLKSECVF